MSFDLDGWQHPVPRMFARRVLELLDMFENIMARIGPVSIDVLADAPALERIEEDIGHGVIMIVAAVLSI